MNPFEIALFLLCMFFGFGIAAFACFWLSTDVRVGVYSKLEFILDYACRIFIALSAISAAMAVLVVVSALVVPFTGMIEL